VQEFSREIPVVRIVGYPEEVAHSMPEQAAPVVVLGPSAALVMDTVEALVGKREHAPRIPEGDRWAYLVHVEGKARWVIVGSVSWTPGDDLSKAAEASYPPTYLVVLDSMSPKITEARKLVATLPQGRAAAVVVMVSVGEDGLQAAKETLSRSLRRLFRVPEDIPLLVSGGVGTAESRKWLRLARG
jgi:hypothetical protein